MIDLLNRPIVRLILIGVLALPVQTTLFADVKFFGVAAQVMLCLAVAAGVTGGSESGAVAGFIFGLLFDLVLSSPLGMLSLLYGLAGFIAGYAHSRTMASPRWLNALVVGGVSSVATLTQPVLANWVGVEGWISTGLVKVVLIVGGLNALFSVIAVPVVRWGLAIKRRERLALSGDVFL
ncbi:MAG: rod shape-determining protein MreD [Actinomycetota bacterium]